MSSPDDNRDAQGLQGTPRSGKSEKLIFRLRKEITIAEILSIGGAVVAGAVFIQQAYASLDDRIAGNQFALQKQELQITFIAQMFKEIKDELKLVNSKLDKKEDRRD